MTLRALRLPAWTFGLVVLLTTAVGTYGRSASWSWNLQIVAGLGLLAVAALSGAPAAICAGIAGATWMVGDLAGWTPDHLVVITVADAWSRLLPGLAVAGVLPWRRRVPPVVALAGSGLAAVSRLLLVDPFLEVNCRATCDHNPLLVDPAVAGAGPWLEAAGAVLTFAAAVWAVGGGLTRRGPAVAAAVLVLAVAVPGEHLILFVIAQGSAVLLAALLIRSRFERWRLSRRLVRLAVTLPAAPGPGEVAEALRTAVGDPGLVVRYWAPERGRYVDADGEPAGTADDRADRTTLVTRRGQPVATLTHSSGVDGEQVHRALGAALRLALENEQLRAATLAELRELRQSRARLVTRGQLERRRLERNLHDGAQQRMVSLALMVRMLGNHAEAVALAHAAVEELRRVARGIYPAVLADAGLSGALLDLAESSTDLPIVLDGVPATRYTGAVETTAYLVAAAAVTDARRHGATRLAICLRELQGRLRLELVDDAAGPERASVAALADQVRALGGDLAVRPGRVWVELPCAW